MPFQFKHAPWPCYEPNILDFNWLRLSSPLIAKAPLNEAKQEENGVEGNSVHQAIFSVFNPDEKDQLLIQKKWHEKSVMDKSSQSTTNGMEKEKVPGLYWNLLQQWCLRSLQFNLMTLYFLLDH